MKVYCSKCGKLLGEIYDARLYKGGREIIFLHEKCYYPEIPKTAGKYDIPEGFEALFGGFRK